MSRTKPVVAIDGPSGAGKSTVSKGVAKALGYVHVNTGALYRAVALGAHRAGVDYTADQDLRELLVVLDLELKTEDQSTRIWLDGSDVTEDLYTPEMSMGASAVSAREPVRAGLLDLQRKLGADGGAVLEGRDIGTVVFPDAEVKIFLSATARERARRRQAELAGKGIEKSLDEVLAEVNQRDSDDASRDLAPMKAAEDAFQLDSTPLSLQEVIDVIAARVRAAEALLSGSTG